MTTEIKDSVYGKTNLHFHHHFNYDRDPVAPPEVSYVSSNTISITTHTPKMDARVETVMRLRYCTVPIL